jgi:glycosyltransferase domain-containing protein
MPEKQLTCLVPTHNRPLFLRRLMRFYTQFRPDFSFLVADSSGPVAAAENRSLIDGVRGELSVRYEHYDLPFYEKIAVGLGSVASPFVALCADDDFLFPNAVSRCAAFLVNEPSYASAMGHKALLNTTRMGWRGNPKLLKGYSIEHELPLDRCRQMAEKWISNFYAVHRTEILHGNFQVVGANSNSQSLPHLPETLTSQLSVLRGRAKVLPIMYSLWQRHDSNWTIAAENGVQLQAELRYQQFKECLIDQFERAGIDRADSEHLVDEWYDHFRYPDLASRRRKVSNGQRISRVLNGILERVADSIWTDRVRHCRSVRSRDLVECESMWLAALQLMRDFPQGIPAEPVPLKRSA